MGQPPPGADLVTASAGSAKRWNDSPDGSMLSARSSGTVTARARLESRARHAASTSCAVTGAPSQKRASDRSVTVQRPSGPGSHDRASAGRTRPWQSTRINVSYSWAKTKRSATLRGNGACAGSTGSVSAIVTVSRDAGRPAAIRHAVSPAARAGAGGGSSPRGTPPPQAAATSRPKSKIWWCGRIMGGSGSGGSVEAYRGPEARARRGLGARFAHHQRQHVPLRIAELGQPQLVVRGPVHEVGFGDELDAPAAQRRMRRRDVGHEVIDDRRRVVELGG